MNISLKEKKNLGYKYHITLMCSGNDTKNKKYIKDAEEIAKGIANRNFVLVNGASKFGLMGVTGRAAKKAGGEVYGVGLNDYEPEIHNWFSNWDGYSTYNYRIKRLTDLGDVFIALAGGLGTIHEILDIHINQFLGKETKPIIILSPMAEIYEDLCNKVKAEGLYWDKLPEYIYFAKDYNEALIKLDEVIKNYDKTGYINKTYYPVMSSTEIYKHIKEVDEKYSVLFSGMKLIIHPDVYPPNRFRSSLTFAKYLNSKSCKNKIVFDIGCGAGNLGLLAAKSGAKQVLSVDINPAAVENTKENINALKLKNIDVREGSVFNAIGNQKADLILFHPPFHKEKVEANQTKLMHCVSTNGFEVLDKFFNEFENYLNPNGMVYLGFSNKDKDSLKHLELLMKKYNTKLIAHEYKGSKADYLLYQIKLN